MKAETARGALAVGLFFVVGMALLVLGLAFFGDGSLLRSKQRAVAYFDGSMAGLSVGAPVTFRGVRIGTVERIELRVDGTRAMTQIPVFLSLNPHAAVWGDDDDGGPDIPTMVRQGLRAQLVSQSFVTGQLFVELDFYPNLTPPSPRSDAADAPPEIPTLVSDYARIVDYVMELPIREMVDAMMGAMQGIDQLSADLRTEMVPMTENLHATLRLLRETIPRLSENLETMRADFSRFGTEAAESMRGLEATTQTISQNFAVLAADMEATSIELRVAATGLNRLLAEDAPMHGDLESATHDLARSARLLRELSETLREKPNALLFGN